MKIFFISTLGCRLNQAESQDLQSRLERLGWRKTDDSGKADLIVINTCVVTQKAEKETRQTIRHFKRINPKAKLVVAGCWSDKIRRFGGNMPEGTDFLLSNQEKWSGLKEIFHKFFKLEHLKLIENCKLPACRRGRKIENSKSIGFRRYIKIQTGCSNNCSYCLTRLVRGKPKSTPIIRIIGAVNEAIKDGCPEVVLTGINISQYNDKDKNWLDLVEEILKKTKVKRLGFGSINPALVENGKKSMEKILGFQISKLKHLKLNENCKLKIENYTSEDYVNNLAKIYNGIGKNRLIRHLHLSLQSGSDKILKLMNRDYTSFQYLKLIENCKLKIENLKVSTDIIVGFPGETDEDFQKTVNLCKKIGFDKIHIFRFSARPGTLAALKEKEWGRVDEKTKRRRSQKLQKLKGV